MSDDYELLPAEELSELRREIEQLKEHPLGESKKAQTLNASVDSLTESINKLIQIFANIDEELVNDASSLQGAHNHFEELKEQNKKLFADVEEMKKILQAQNTLQQNFPQATHPDHTTATPQTTNPETTPNILDSFPQAQKPEQNAHIPPQEKNQKKTWGLQR